MASSLIIVLVLSLASSGLSAPGTDRKVNSCGCAKPLSTNRIVGGTEVKKDAKYPYQIWVQGLGACGGSIINKRYILSAAHCFGKPGQKNIKVTDNNYVMLGTNDMMGMDGQFLMIEKIIMHPGYNKELGNDVAIIKVTTDIQFSDKVRPVCLDTDKKKDYTGQMATVTGWGGTKGYNPGQKSPEQPEQYIMKETKVKVLKDSEPMCEVATGGDKSARFCAWAKNTGSCQGDSGGPLTVVDGGKFVQIGIVSYAAGCGTSTVEGAGVYARVSNFVDWISKVTADGNC